jgi:hypothetical protein
LPPEARLSITACPVCWRGVEARLVEVASRSSDNGVKEGLIPPGQGWISGGKRLKEVAVQFLLGGHCRRVRTVEEPRREKVVLESRLYGLKRPARFLISHHPASAIMLTMGKKERDENRNASVDAIGLPSRRLGLDNRFRSQAAIDEVHRMDSKLT